MFKGGRRIEGKEDENEAKEMMLCCSNPEMSAYIKGNFYDDI